MVSNKGNCVICRHTQVAKIEGALLAGIPTLQVSKRFGVARSSLQRHEANHIAEKIQAAALRKKERGEDLLLESAEGLFVHLLRLLRKSEDAQDFSSAVAAARAARELLEFSVRNQPPPPAAARGIRVRLEFTSRGHLETHIEPAEAIEVAAEPELQNAAPESSKPDQGAVSRPVPPTPPELGWREKRWQAEERAEEQADREADQEKTRTAGSVSDRSKSDLF